MDSFDILVIILSVTLAVFLILAIVATIFLIKVLKKVQQASNTAKLALDNVQSITGSVKRLAGSGTAAGVAASLWRVVRKSKRK